MDKVPNKDVQVDSQFNEELSSEELSRVQEWLENNRERYIFRYRYGTNNK